MTLKFNEKTIIKCILNVDSFITYLLYSVYQNDGYKYLSWIFLNTN